MIGLLLVGLLTQCFGVRVGFLCCGEVALVTLILLRPFWTRKLTGV
jgi:hypothetical protein